MTAYQAERFFNPATCRENTELKTGEGEFIAFPPEYPQDGEGVAINFFGGHPIIAHPEHRPYIFKNGVWEVINPIERPLTFSGEMKEDGDRMRTQNPYDK